MFLDSLTIKNNSNDIIREVRFNARGLNLIVGIKSKNGTTNNIGKTTLIRCIDFCLGGKIEQLYKDKEFKTSNKGILNFLEQQQPTFQICLKKQHSEKEYKIVRKIINDGKLKTEDAIFIDDNKLVESKDFHLKLKEIFFNSDVEKPSFRQLIPKFIRKDDYQLNNVLKFLHPTTSDITYEKIHLFLFGFPNAMLLHSKSNIELELKQKEKVKQALGSRFNVIDLKQILEIANKELENLYRQREEFKIDEKYEIEEKQLTDIQLELMKIEKEISDLKFKKNINMNNLQELEKRTFNDDTQALKLLYEEAKFYSDTINKSFKEVVGFHNQMIQNEMDYIENKIVYLDKVISELIPQRNELSMQYSALMEKLSKTGSLAEYTKLNEQIEKMVEERGRDEKLLDELRKIEEEINTMNNKMLELTNEINENLHNFNNTLGLFNESFSEYSKLLYDDRFFVSYNPEENPIKFSIKNIKGNEGSGKKQATISAFDLAYLDFIDKINLNFPHFVAHDKVELIDVDKLKLLFDISNKINGQFIVPIIYDKIETFYSDYKDRGHIILELSEENKFFNF